MCVCSLRNALLRLKGVLSLLGEFVSHDDQCGFSEHHSQQMFDEGHCDLLDLLPGLLTTELHNNRTLGLVSRFVIQESPPAARIFLIQQPFIASFADIPRCSPSGSTWTMNGERVEITLEKAGLLHLCGTLAHILT